jgi:hypothetical protein
VVVLLSKNHPAHVERDASQSSVDLIWGLAGKRRENGIGVWFTTSPDPD